jgi:hypothetical protein
MRELIYLSENKLQRFQTERSAGLWRRVRQVEVKAPLGTGVNVGLSDPIAKSHPDLAKVLKHIDRSDSPASWFEEEGLEPGEWVKFEARLNYVIYSEVVERYDQKGTLRPSPTPPPPPLFSGSQSRGRGNQALWFSYFTARQRIWSGWIPRTCRFRLRQFGESVLF